MLFSLDGKIVPCLVPCFGHSMYCNWLPHCLGLQKSNWSRSLLLVALMARINHNGTFWLAIHLGLFQVSLKNANCENVAIIMIKNFLSFLVLLCCDNATYKFRSVMVPIHAIFGIITFMLAIATALTGFLQKARFDLG